MMTETHLFIIWSKARYKEKDIIADIQSHFELLGVHEISWDKKNFSDNLTRFYGENLPPNSGKELHCGNDPFLLIVVKDKSPLYRVRNTSKGLKTVNVNMFDSKEMYRRWTGGGHKIHGTNDECELRHDLLMLTGMTKSDYLAAVDKSSKILTMPFTEMIGENGWDNMQQIFYVLNETVEYVVLRNFSDLFSDYSLVVHGDIDILVSDRKHAKYMLNAIPQHFSKKRVRHYVKIDKGGTYFDIRYLNDNYYCMEWERNILETRIMSEKGYYRPNYENYIYSLLYHAVIQKKEIASDYKKKFIDMFHLEDKNELKVLLYEYLKMKDYKIVEPVDYSVCFEPISKREYIPNLKGCSKFMYKVLDRLEGMKNAKK